MSTERASQPRPGPWRQAATELTVAAVVVVACGASAYAIGGLGASAVVVTVLAALCLALLAGVATSAEPAPLPSEEEVVGRQTSSASFGGYWRLVSNVANGSRYMNEYKLSLRPALQHALATRLAERYGVNLYREPDRARAVFSGGGAYDYLWPWVDPEGDPPGTNDGAGVPMARLERLVERVEQV